MIYSDDARDSFYLFYLVISANISVFLNIRIYLTHYIPNYDAYHMKSVTFCLHNNELSNSGRHALVIFFVDNQKQACLYTVMFACF